MAEELASGYVSLSGDTRQLGQDIRSAYGEAESGAEQTGRRSGGLFGGAFGGALKVGGAAVAGVAGAGLAAAFTKGFGRLTAIDDAQGKLRGLGHDAEAITQIMDNATAAVKGTAFGLGDAATVAATAVAAGIKPGQDLTKYLTLTGDAATIAGSSLDEMGSIFNKVTTNGVAMTDDLQMLADRGIPIFTWLQEEYKVTGGELSKMVQDGKVDSATFQKVIADNIGGAAQEGGKTFSGAMANMMAALGRFGATLLGPIFAKGPAVFGALTTGVDMVGKAVGGLGSLLIGGDYTGKLFDAFGWEEDNPMVTGLLDLRQKIIDFANIVGPVLKGAFDILMGVLSGVGNAFMSAFGFIREHEGLFKGIAVVIGSMLVPALVVMAFNWVKNIALFTTWRVISMAGMVATKLLTGAIWLMNAAMKANPIGIIVTLLAGLVAGLAYFFTQTELGRTIWTTVWEGIKSALAAAWGFIKPIWDGFLNALAWIGEKLLWLWNSVVSPVFGFIGNLISMWWNNIVKPVWDAFTNVLGIVGAALNWFWTSVVQPVFNFIGAAISFWWTNVVQPAFELFKAGVGLVGDIVMWLWHNIIQPAFDTIGQIIQAVWNNVISPAFDAFKKGMEILGDAVNWLWNNVIKPVWDALGAGISWVIDNVVKPAFDGMKTALSAVGDMFGKIVDGIKTAWDKVKEFVAKPINFVIETVWNNGLLKAWNKIAEWLPGLSPTAPLAPVAFDQGGATKGRRGKDTIPALLGGDEHVMDRFDVDALGGQRNVYAMRRMLDLGIPFSWDAVNGLKRAREGVVDAIATAPRGADMAGFLHAIGVPGYDKGGAGDPGKRIRPAWEIQLENGHRAAKMRDGNPYTWGFEDCSGYMSMIADAIINGGDGVRRWATGSFPGGQPWQRGLGPGFSVGVHDNPGGPGGGHTAGTLQGVGPYQTVNVESGGSHGRVAYGGPAVGADDPQWDGKHPGRFHLGIGADGAFMSGGAGGGPSPETQSNFLKDKIREIIDSFMNPVKDIMRGAVPAPPPEWYRVPELALNITRDKAVDVATGIVGTLGSGLRTVYDTAKSVINSTPLGGVIGGVVGGITSVFRDQGGFVPNGLTLVRNETGKPEAVLNWEQLDKVKGMMEQGQTLMEAVRSLNLPKPADDATADVELSHTSTLSDVKKAMDGSLQVKQGFDREKESLKAQYDSAVTGLEARKAEMDAEQFKAEKERLKADYDSKLSAAEQKRDEAKAQQDADKQAQKNGNEPFSAAKTTKEFMGTAGKIIGESLFDILNPFGSNTPDPVALADRYTIEPDDKNSKGSTDQQADRQDQFATATDPSLTQPAAPDAAPKGYVAPKGMDQTNYAVTPDAVTPLPDAGGSGGTGRDAYLSDIASAAKDMGLGLYEGIIATGTALVESELKMYANSKVPESLNFPHDAVGSDGTSVGLFQQQQNGAWGTVADGMNAYKSAGMFYGALTKFDYKSMSKGSAAQKVQASAFGSKYDPRMAEAEELIKDKFDTGGLVRPGLSVVENRTGGTEHLGILTNDQWSTLQETADNGGGQMVDQRIIYERGAIVVQDLAGFQREQKNQQIKRSMGKRGRP